MRLEHEKPQLLPNAFKTYLMASAIPMHRRAHSRLSLKRENIALQWIRGLLTFSLCAVCRMRWQPTTQLP